MDVLVIGGHGKVALRLLRLLARQGHRTCRHFRTYPEFRELKRKQTAVPPAERKRFRFFGR